MFLSCLALICLGHLTGNLDNHEEQDYDDLIMAAIERHNANSR